MLDDQSMRSSLQVAPLSIQKKGSGSLSNASQESEADAATYPYSQSQLTPPTTPNDSQEDLVTRQSLAEPVFHNFLRAFYPFHPTYAMSDSTITLPLNEGDVVLVHSIHTNGWADGTLLLTGARGWLPTNYCEAYCPEEMKNLLKALLNFWDLLRSSVTNDQDVFGNQEFMKGIIAGVRFLLERTHCLTRESPTIQRCDHLRRARKSLLSELSALVKTSKRLQETIRQTSQCNEVANDIIDEMILKAFKIVVKGMRFLDLLEEDRRLRAPAVTVMATVVEESVVPPTPPAESTTFQGVPDVDSRQDADKAVAATISSGPVEGTQAPQSANDRLSSVHVPTNAAGESHRVSRAPHNLTNRISASISHRVSLAGPSPISHSHKLVSERLNTCHDTFLSYLGSFIGRLQLQSQSRPELALAIRQSASSGGELLAVVIVVSRHNPLVSETLGLARANMYNSIRELVSSSRVILNNSATDPEDIIMPHDNRLLLHSATGCVKAAGECVAKAKWVLERIGDFEFEFEKADGKENGALGIDLDSFGIVSEDKPRALDRNITEITTSQSSPIPIHQTIHSSMEKPLPEIPTTESTPENRNSIPASPPPSRPQSTAADEAVPHITSLSSSIRRPSLPTLSKLTTSIMPEEAYSPTTTEASHDNDYYNSFHSDSATALTAGTNSSFASRDSETSVMSHTSTRATTPETNQAPKNQPSLSDISTTGSASLSEDADDVESKLLEKTFAQELIFNKEGQVVGGSLAALVERLTTHESTPDATFVSAFYLTFRLFCTPTQLAEALVDRFDYVGETPRIASPVRLRVYNVMKGWLESHWRDSTDQEALPLLQSFAEFKLGSILPSAGRRLIDLTVRVSSADGSLVPRLVSSKGKTNTSMATFVPADTPLPSPILSKSQQNLLSNWKSGGSCPSILDFDSLELARQLTVKQMSIFCRIMPEELLGSRWMKKTGAVDSPNIKAMSGFSTVLSNFVADTILQFSEVKKRALVIKHWIKIGHHCLELNNYDALMTICCSLKNSTISRLHKTWDIVSLKRKEMLKSLQAIVETSNNYKVLRARLQGHVPPCLPFLGMFLTDLAFVDIGNPATKQIPGAGSDDQGLTVVNFDKHSRTAKIIGELQRFQIPYRLTEVPDLQEWIQGQLARVKELDQDKVQVTFYRKSMLLEPREVDNKTPVEGPQSAAPGTSQKGDLFGWISRDRHNQNNNSAATLT